ncbi:glycosyltransferase [Puniceicoccus vermicola]|uniref:Glycosyltransferase n=1 Tax=Puniceicoccus vermicola TaxID=388746 RepID=A0A7X1E5E7_9BACT|nr:glycosyltransferase [Puniceicoccus vermicola]MBC2603575.1 glycosyltransferase [Puniceicoccus vermicola]
MRITYIGSFESDYPRNRTIANGLRLSGIEVTELRIDLWKGVPHKFKIGFGLLLWLSVKYFFGCLWLFFRGLFHQTDCYLVGYPGHWDMFTCRLLAFCKRKPIVFDAFVSLWDSLVMDRETLKEDGLKAKAFFWLDRSSCSLADHILVDTPEHADFFAETFGIARKKITPIPVGCDQAVYHVYSEIEKREKFTVVFHGKSIPLQGLEYIVSAAEILLEEGVQFVITADGQTAERSKREAIRRKITNIEWHGWTPSVELARRDSACHVGLGIFGTTPKARRVIPNKVFEMIRLGLPLITGDTPAVRSILSDGRDCIMVPVGDPEAIARAILKLRDSEDLRTRIAVEAQEVYEETWTLDKIGEQVCQVFREVVPETRG